VASYAGNNSAYSLSSAMAMLTGACVMGNEQTNEVYLPMNGVNNDWLPVKAEAHQSWSPKK